MAWAAVYRLNGPAWDGLLYDVARPDPAARVTDALHFFGYDAVKIILLRRVLKPQLLAAFVAVVGTGIVAIGYLFNAVLAWPSPTTAASPWKESLQ